jgi:hypothetical protein
MSLGDYFHVGIVVPRVEAAQARFTELLGVEWGPLLENEIPITTGDGAHQVVTNRMCYSTSPPYLELIQETPGTPWVCNEHSNLHHLGFFSDAMGTDSGRLAAASCPLELMDGTEGGVPMWAYHRDPLGVRIEVVTADMRPMMEQHLFRSAD